MVLVARAFRSAAASLAVNCVCIAFIPLLGLGSRFPRLAGCQPGESPVVTTGRAGAIAVMDSLSARQVQFPAIPGLAHTPFSAPANRPLGQAKAPFR
jgi:hypothetical protein